MGIGGRDPAPHKQKAQENEEHAIGVDGGDSRLSEVHEFKGKERGAAHGNLCFAE